MSASIDQNNSSNSPVFFSLVILCYRAEEGIIPFIEKVHRLLDQYQFNWEMILVANYHKDSGDRTPEVCLNLKKRLRNIQVVSEPKEGMMGWDLRKGLASAQGQYIAFIDGDGQFPVEAVFSCLAKIQFEDLDLVKTYRVHRRDGWYRRTISFVYNLLFKTLFGGHLSDANSKPKILTRKAYEQLNLQSDAWFIDAEIMIKAGKLKFKIAEVPTLFYTLEDRASFIKVSAIFEFIRNMFKTRFGKN